MKFICERKVLVEYLSNIQRSVAVKSNIVALEGVHIFVDNGIVRFSTFNMEYGVKTEFNVSVFSNGKVVIPGKIFFDITKRLPDGDVIVELITDDSSEDKNEINIISKNCKFSIPSISSDDFPKLPIMELENFMTFSSSILISLIKQTIFAVSEDDLNPIHTGVLIEVKEKVISFVAVDGFRLSLRRENIDLENEFSIIVPGKTLSEVCRLIFNDDLDINVSISEHYIFFKIGDYELISRLLEGNFIDYVSVIPTIETLNVTVNTRDFIESIERVSLVVNQQLKSPIIAMVDEELIMLSCKTFIGKSNDEFSVCGKGSAIEIAFNNRYMLDALKNSDSDEITVSFDTAFKPIKITPIVGDRFLFLVLPVRTYSDD